MLDLVMIRVEKHLLKVTVLLLVHDMMGGKALIAKKKKTEIQTAILRTLGIRIQPGLQATVLSVHQI